MLENIFIVVITNFVKIIHVQLPDEGTEISVSEMYWQDFLFESLDIDDDKIRSVLVPSDYVFVLVVLNRKEITSRIWYVFEIKMGGPEFFYFFHLIFWCDFLKSLVD